MKKILLPNQFFNLSKKRSRVPAGPTKVLEPSINFDRDGSSAMSLGAHQRRSIASSLRSSTLNGSTLNGSSLNGSTLNSSSLNGTERSYFLELDQGGVANRRRKSQCNPYYNSLDMSNGNETAKSSSIDGQSDLQEQSSNYGSSTSSIFAEESKQDDTQDDIEFFPDFVVKMSKIKKSKKRCNETRAAKRKKSFVRALRNFVMKTLKVPLAKKHQRWSRYSFEDSGQFEPSKLFKR